jgi:hypothetical protein
VTVTNETYDLEPTPCTVLRALNKHHLTNELDSSVPAFFILNPNYSTGPSNEIMRTYSMQGLHERSTYHNEQGIVTIGIVISSQENSTQTD